MSSNPAPPGALAHSEDATCTNKKIGARGISPQPARPLPAAIGRYRIIRLLGEGGMGIVYEAEQDQPRRRVAIKLLKTGVASPDLFWRFEHESQALGRLKHPGIAQIYEAGTADNGSGPQPYFAMELIRGEPLLEYAEAHHLNTLQRLEVMVRICGAVQHAHQSGIIHRDLKPSNILVEESGQPKILDLGVARITDSDVQATHQTDLGQLVGTLAYMSPEQVLADPMALDTRSDVYALGVILFELLAGRLPYKISRHLPAAVHTIREEDPARLSAVSRTYRGDIETIVGKALEKDKTRRYASAADLAADIQRYLHDEPITARSPSATYQLQKFARRHPALVVGIAAVFVVLIVGIIVSTWEALQARRAEAKAQALSDFLQKDLLGQASPREQGRPDIKPDPDLKVRTALDRAAARIAGKFVNQPLVEASIRQTIGNVYKDLGLYADAQRQLERAVQLRRRMLGDKHLDTLGAMNDLGQLYGFNVKYSDAEQLYNRILDIRRHVLGEEHPDTLRTIDDLANIYYLQRRYADAERLFTRLLQVRRRVSGEENPATLDAISDLGCLYATQGKYAASEQFLQREIELRSRVQGPEHPATLLATYNLAYLDVLEGSYPNAEQLSAGLLTARRRTLGPEHPDTLLSMTILASAYLAEGKYADAEPLYTRALEIEQRHFGERHPITLSTMSSLGELYACQGKYQQARLLYNRAREQQHRTLGQDHPDTLLNEQRLAELYGYQGKYQEAEALFATVLEGQRRVFGRGHPALADTMNRMAKVYEIMGKYSEAEPLFQDALEIQRHALRPDHPATLATFVSMGELYVRQQRYSDGESLLRSAAASFARSAAADTWSRYHCESILGASLAGQKKFAEAEPLLISGYEGMSQRQSTIPAFSRVELQQAAQRIPQLYQDWGKPKKAAQWRAKLKASLPADQAR